MGSQFTRLCVAALVVCACSSALGGHGPWTVQAPRVVVIVWVLVYALRWLRDSSNARALQAKWRDVAAKKRRARDDLRVTRPLRCEEPEAETRRAILTASARQLRDGIASGSYSCHDVVATFAKRAASIGARLDLNAEECFHEALEAAKTVRTDRNARLPAADEAAQPGVQLLRGVPLSVKDQYYQRGYDSTCGTACKAFKPAAQDGLLVELLRDAGAIPFVRSNVPQCLMLPESDNAVWGQARNPCNETCTPGGSSGGESGLVAALCSPLGIGTDIGGSIRIPAHFCGVFGFKPTPQRLSRKGLAAPRSVDCTGQEAIVSAAGPIGKSVEDLVLVMRAWLVEKMWTSDPSVPRLPFSLATFRSTQRLRIGYFKHLSFFHSCATAERSVQMVVDALGQRADVELVPFEVPDCTEMVQLYYGIMAAEGGMRGFLDGLAGEELHPLYRKLYIASQIPASLSGVTAWVLRALGQRRVASIASAVGAKSTAEYWDLLVRRTLLKRNFLLKWKEAGLDALIGPTLALPAIRHGDSKEMTPSFIGTFMYNLLHLPAGVCPVTHVRSDELEYRCPKGQNDQLAGIARKIVANAEGLPFTVQVAGLPFQDEVVLRVMEMIETHVPFAVGSGTPYYPTDTA